MVSKCCQSIVMITVIFFSIVAIADGITLVDAADKSGRFTGTWVANGTRDVLPFGEKRETAFLKLSGHVNLKDQVGMHWVGRLRVRQ